jgi:hypothetical protein
MAVRQCPQCSSIGSLSPSHLRNSNETFLAILMPLTYPYRCSVCNWRGMMGRFSIIRNAKVNTAINAIIYVAFFAVAVYFLAEIRQRLHSS